MGTDGNQYPEPLKLMLPSLIPVLNKAAGGPYKHQIELPNSFVLLDGKRIKVGRIDVEYHVDETHESTSTQDALDIFSHILRDYKSRDIEFLKRKDE